MFRDLFLIQRYPKEIYRLNGITWTPSVKSKRSFSFKFLNIVRPTGCIYPVGKLKTGLPPRRDGSKNTR